MEPKRSVSGSQGFCWWSSQLSLSNIRPRIQLLCRSH